MVIGTGAYRGGTAMNNRPSEDEKTVFDVLIVGAGISGIGHAQHIQSRHPARSFVILEAREAPGGTWLTHKYPGARSDSDLFTFGYRARPWNGPPIATRQEILSYLGATIEAAGLSDHIRYGHRVESASWSSAQQCWVLRVADQASGSIRTYRARFLWMCQGYYDHDTPYTPTWPDMERFAGTIVHPQHWPDEMDWTGKRVVVIGSGATAATLIPALAQGAAHVTMLQRSPTYFVAKPNKNELADTLRALDIPDAWTHEIVRRSVLAEQKVLQVLAEQDPDAARDLLVSAIREELGPEFDVDTHFNPGYRPWRQRLAVVPDNDLFKVIKAGKASVVTDQIARFTPGGIALESGQELAADIIVTATGFNMQFLNDIPFDVDGDPVAFHDKVSYRGLMVSDVPNMAFMLGYLRTSWTMRVDLAGDFVCRLMGHMDSIGAASVTPVLGEGDAGLPRGNFIPDEEFNSGYIQRGMPDWPRRIERDPWRYVISYFEESAILPEVDLDEAALVYG